MKSYLSLIPISAKLKRKQNNMTLLCIVFAVFLVTSIFSMADIGVKMEKNRLIAKHGAESLELALKNSTITSLYIIAFVFFILILIAGILMISSSINSNISQRTQFFGMMRCIGMSKKQIIRFVRLESLNWCKISIPMGILLGVISTWILSLILKFFVAGEFTNIPLFQISFIGIISGVLMGIISVLISASIPAKKAAKVSPIVAASGNENADYFNSKVIKNNFKIEKSLGLNHAISNRKNFRLIISSFALSIILFLSFSVFIDFIGHIMPQKSNTPDFSITSFDGTNSVDHRLIEKLENINGVKNIYGRQNKMDIPVKFTDKSVDSKVDIVSYSDFDLNSLIKDKELIKNSNISKVYGKNNQIIITPDKDNNLRIKDKIIIDNKEMEIAGILKNNIFSSDGSPDGNLTIITSNETYTDILDEKDFSLLMIQSNNKITDENINEIKNLLNDNYEFKDMREQQTSNMYKAFKLCIYGFLIIISLVAVLNIVNNINLSVNSKIKQYGFMKAVGMSQRQVNKMIITEALVYAISGCALGLIIGLFISNRLYYTLITKHFPLSAWRVPVNSIIIIILFILISILLAVYKPIKEMKKISITEIINKL